MQSLDYAVINTVIALFGQLGSINPSAASLQS